MGQTRRRGRARIDFDGNLGVCFKPEARAQVLHQPGEFVVGQEGWRATTKMQLRHRNARAQFLDMQRDVLRQRIQIAGGAFVMTRHHLVTGAVVTDRVAERDMDVQRQGRGRAGDAPLLQRLPVVLLAESGVIAISRGVRGVSRPILVQPCQQLGREKGRAGGWGRRCGTEWA
ncbi:hypothetical protein G6F65_021666 [Rhizopus arrhizus]|nr:hypothetical protein G6F65_021666 [Rhizopus arrhizus]